ncbi:hypothetical protein EPJ71_04610 [Brachyspira aalborgi]|uniref:Uncharacterized protein n=1 Tax=Brachyspira aalborgi TaxID=29522 RepID=A0ABY3K9I6_9SPIR|nr:hypothetical protein EPJ71_04610 [Brachyspira aalborgi]
MPCLALPCLALPCLALPCLALPCLASILYLNKLNLVISILKNIMLIYGIFNRLLIIIFQNILKSNYIYFSNIKNYSNKIYYLNSS